jgi:hypothetical protein
VPSGCCATPRPTENAVTYRASRFIVQADHPAFPHANSSRRTPKQGLKARARHPTQKRDCSSGVALATEGTCSLTAVRPLAVETFAPSRRFS